MSFQTLLVVSNGHGEDVIATRIARSTLAACAGAEPELLAMPLVGLGSAYAAAGIALYGPRREMPSGGLTIHHPRLLLADLRAGILGLTLRQAAALRRSRPLAVLVVGDAYAHALAALVRAPRAVYQPLVSVHQSVGAPGLSLRRLFMDRIRAPELLLMRGAERLFARDEPTAEHLRTRGLPRATHLGNPMMDGLVRAPSAGALPSADRPARVALLPGSRSYRDRSLALMLAALDAWSGPALTAEVAWTEADPPEPPSGWIQSADGSWTGASSRARVRVRCGAFEEVLAGADAVLGTSGTANEQAAGLGLPVVAFPVLPDYGEAFLAGQKRLLGDALEVVAADAAAIAAGLGRALTDPVRRREAAAMGPARMGGEGASERIGAALAAWLEEVAERGR